MITITEITNGKLPGYSSLLVEFPYNDLIVNICKATKCAIYDKKSKKWEIPSHFLSKFVNKVSDIDDVEIHLLEKKKNHSHRKVNVNWESYKNFTPFSYQKEGVQELLKHEQFMLLDDMGLGKSVQAMVVAEERHKLGQIEHCLVVCGVASLKYNWLKEITKFSNLQARILGQKKTKTGKLVIGSISDRLKDLQKPIGEFFIITNIETLRDEQIVKELNSNKHNKIDMIIFDEAHAAKNPSAQQSKGLLKLKAKYKLAMTGTILTNTPEDAYMCMKWLAIQSCNFTNFKYFYEEYGGYMNSQVIGYKNMDILKRMIEENSLRRTKDILDLPDKILIEETIEMNDKQQNLYNNIVDGIVSQVDKVHISTVNLLAMCARLRQATACPSILTTENIVSSKIERAVDLCEQAISGNHSVVIFCTFKDCAKELMTQLSKYNPLLCTGDVKDETISKNVEDFQNGKSKIMIATWQKMGTGITLTKGDVEIFIDTPWTSAVFEQAQDRCYRIGQKNKVTIYNLVCKDTFDERVSKIVQNKKILSDYVVDDKVSDQLAEELRKMILDL